MSGENEAITLLSFRTDQAGVQAGAAAYSKLEASAIKYAQAAALSTGGAIRFDTVQQAAAALGVSTQQILGTEKAITVEKQNQLTLANLQLETTRQAQATFVDRQGGGTRSFGQNVTRLGRGLFNAPDIGGVSTPLARGLIGGGGALDALGVGAATFGAVAAVAIPLVVGLVAVTSAYGKSAEIAADRAKTSAAAISAALASGSTAQLQAIIKQKETEIAVAETTRTLLLDKAKEADGQLANFLETSSHDLSARLNQAARDIGLGGSGANPNAATFDNAPLIESSEAYTAQATEQTKIIEQAQIALEVYSLIMGDSNLIVTDLTVAEKALAEQRQEIVEQQTRIQNDQLSSALSAQQLTSEQRAERIADDEAEIATRDAYRQSHTLTEAALVANAQAVDQLRNNIVELSAVEESRADVLARLEALEQRKFDRAEMQLDLVDQEISAREDLFAVQQKMTDLQAEAVGKLSDLALDASERRQELEATSGERLVEIAEDSAERRAKIERDFGRSHEDAVRSRNVVADIRAREQAADALADQDAGVNKQVETVAKALAKQEATLNKSYAKQVAAVGDSLDKSLRTQQRALAEAEHQIASSQASQAFLASSGMNNIVNETTNGWTAITNNFAVGMGNLAAAVRAQLGGGGSQFPTNPGGFETLTNSAAGRALDARMATVARRTVDKRLRQVWE